MNDILLKRVIEAWSEAVGEALAGKQWMQYEAQASSGRFGKLQAYLEEHPVRGTHSAVIHDPSIPSLIIDAQPDQLAELLDEEFLLPFEGQLAENLRDRMTRRRAIEMALICSREPNNALTRLGIDTSNLLGLVLGNPAIARLARFATLVRTMDITSRGA